MPLLRSVSLDKLISSFFYVGFLRPAPGTWGSAVGIILAYIFLKTVTFMTFCLLLLFVILIGFWGIKKYIGKNSEKSDPAEVVLDEVIGQWIAVLPIGYMIQLPEFNFEGLMFVWIWAFVSFRFFDIIKLGLVGWADNLGGALGVILDDILAGMAAGFTVAVVLLLT